jgi:hypothetical protein
MTFETKALGWKPLVAGLRIASSTHLLAKNENVNWLNDCLILDAGCV